MGLSSWSLDHIAFSWRVIPKAFRIKDPWESWNYQFSSGGLMSLRKENSMSEAYQSLTHSRWNGKYHVVFVPKRRRKALFGHIRQALGPILPELARQKECRIIEGHLRFCRKFW